MRAWAWCSVLWLAGCWGAHDGVDPHDGIDGGPDAPPHDVGLDARGSPRPDVPRDVPPDHPDAPPLLVEVGPPPDAPVGPVAAVGEGRSFVVELAITYDVPGAHRLPATLTGTVLLSERGSESVAVPAIQTSVYRVTVDRAADAPWPVSFASRSTVVGDCVPLLELRVVTELTPLDDDGDGLADRLVGSGTGSMTELVSDAFLLEHPFTATVTGWAEDAPARLSWQTSYPDHVPLERSTISLVASEPVVVPDRAWLEDGPNRVELDPSPRSGLAMTFRIRSEAPLPFGARLVLHTEPPLAGVDGLPVATPPPLVTLPLAASPVIDFEDPTGYHAEGAARPVSGIGSIPAIGGSTSLLVESWEWSRRAGLMVARVAVAETDTQVRFRLRYLFRGAAPSLPFRPPIYVALDRQSRWPSEGPSASSAVATGDPTFGWASEVLEVTLPVPSGAREVSLVIGARWPCFGMVPSYPSYDVLVDDVRAE